MTLPIAVIIPHGGLDIPPEIADRIALTPAQIFNDADAFTSDIYDYRDRVLHWQAFPIARALIDVNRMPGEHKTARIGDGMVKRQSSYGADVYKPDCEPDADLEQQLIARYWQPWHDSLRAIGENPDIKLVIDGHSMAATTPTAYGDPSFRRARITASNRGNRRGEVRDGDTPISAPPALTRRFSRLLGEAVVDIEPLTQTGVLCDVNIPFWGGRTITAYRRPDQYWLMIEVNRGLYIGDQTGSSPIVVPAAERIALLRERIWEAIATLAAQVLAD